MASGDAWQAGWNLGSGLAGQRYAQKQGRANELWEDQRDQLKTNIANLASKYASQLGPNGQPTPASLQTKYILQQAELNKDLFENPIKGPGAMERLGWLLHLSSRPQAHTGTFQTGGDPIPGVQIAAPNNPPAAGDARFAVPAGEPPNPVLLKRTGTETAAQPAQGLPSPASQPAAAPPTMPSGAPTSAATTATAPDTTTPAAPAGTQAQTSPPTAAPTPTRPVQTVAMKVPGLTRRQIQQQAQARLRAQQETEMLTAAAPPSPEQQAIQAAQAGNAGLLATVRGRLDAIRQFHPGATPEQLQEMDNRMLDTVLGTKAKSPLVPLPGSKPYLAPDGLYYQPMRDTETGGIVAEPMPEGYKPPLGTVKAAWSKDEKGRIYSANLDPATHQEIPGTRNYNLVPPASLVGRISTGQFHYVDENGQVHEVEETRTSTPMGGGGGTRGGASPAAPSSGSPATGAAPRAGARTKVPGIAALRSTAEAGRDRVIGWKGTKEYNDLRTQYHGALSRRETMDKNLVHALRGDQQAMLSLVANHIGMTLGAQKGARINQAVWNEAVASAPWIEASASKWFHHDPSTGDLIFDGFKTGVTLTPDQMQSMVNLAHEQVDTLKDSLDRLTKEQQPSQGGAPQATGDADVDAIVKALNKGK